MSDVEEVTRAVSDALANAVSPEMVTRWVACIEVLNEEGARGLWLLSAEGMKAWDSMGMLHFAVAAETAASTSTDDD